MFQLKQEQLAAFERAARTNFHHRLAAYLREVMPQESAEYRDDALIRHIEASDLRASRHGIETESGIAQWACLALIFGLDFDDTPMVCEYFQAPVMSSEAKLEVLVDGLNESLTGSREDQG